MYSSVKSLILKSDRRAYNQRCSDVNYLSQLYKCRLKIERLTLFYSNVFPLWEHKFHVISHLTSGFIVSPTWSVDATLTLQLFKLLMVVFTVDMLIVHLSCQHCSAFEALLASCHLPAVSLLFVFMHRYRYFPDRRGGVSGFGVPPSSTRRQQADDQGGRHVWGRGNQLGDNWVPPAAEPHGCDWSQLCQRRPAQLTKRGQNFFSYFLNEKMVRRQYR